MYEKEEKMVNDRLLQNKKSGGGKLAQNLNSYRNVAEVCGKRILRKDFYKQSKLRLEWI